MSWILARGRDEGVIMGKQLEVKSLTVGFRSGREVHNAVSNVTYYLNRGETLCIVGESGCGKSVSVSSILRLLPESSTVISGEILFGGIDLLQAEEKTLDQIRGDKISMIFQEPMTSLNPSMTIGRQLIESVNAHERVPKEKALDLCKRMLTEVGIHDAERCMNAYPHEFSGGMRQRVMIAMAMICKPEILIADEPTTALDVTVQAQILSLMRKLKNEYGTSIIFITHDMGVVAEMADDVIVMYAGEIVEKSSVTELFTNPKHPYTKGLLASLPHIGEKQNRLYSIEGTVPSLANMPAGCRFKQRCKEKCDACNVHPDLYKSGEGYVRCVLYSRGDDL